MTGTVSGIEERKSKQGRTPEEWAFSLALGKRLEARRKIRRMTYKDVGEKIGISLQQIGKMEDGSAIVSVFRLFQLAAALDTTPEELILGLKTPGHNKPEAE
jgi:transcriptional regulator with XRE-family HTH domain